MNRVKRIKTYYDTRKSGALKDHELLGWESREAQISRFEILLSNVALEGRKILDVGCGLGNLLEYMEEKGICTDYTGIDLLGEMIERAKEKSLKGRFIHGDIFKDSLFDMGSFDAVYSSGIFNIDLGNNKLFLQSALAKFCELSKEYVVFNLLHEKSPSKEAPYFYYNPAEVMELIGNLCGEAIEVRIIEQYLKNDFSVIIRKL